MQTIGLWEVKVFDKVITKLVTPAPPGHTDTNTHREGFTVDHLFMMDFFLCAVIRLNT